MESRPDRTGGHAEDVGDLRRLVSDVVAKHENRAFPRGQPPERPIELVAIGNVQEVVRSNGRLEWEHPQIGDSSSLTTRLLDADMGEESMNPGVEPVRIAEVPKITPGDHQRVLQGILGPIDVPEDPLRDREEPVATQPNQVDKRRLVAVLGRLDEVAIHPHHRVQTSVGDVVRAYWWMVRRERWKNGAPAALRRRARTPRASRRCP